MLTAPGHAALDPQANVSKPKSTKATIQPLVSPTASGGHVCAESGSAGAAGDSAGEAETSVQGEAEPSKPMSGNGCAVRGTVDQLSMTAVIFPISDGVVVAVPKETLSTQLQESLKTAPVTTKLVLATKTSSTSGAITPTTFVTSFVQGFPSSISLPAEFHDQVPASQVQQEGKGKDQYSLATGQVVVGVLVLVGFGKVIEHVVKKAWNALGMCYSRYSFQFFKCLPNPMKPSIFVSFAFVVIAGQRFSTRRSNTMACVLTNMLVGSQWRAARGRGYPSLRPSVVDWLHRRCLPLGPIVASFSLVVGILDCPNMGCRGGA